MDEKHTPGPWTAQDYIVRGPDGCLIFDVAGKYTTIGEDTANALLAAAAPELLQAGKHLAVKLADAYRLGQVDPRECQALTEFMRIAAKAEGRQ